ncbi:MAG: serine/threonine-protein kinase [Myxococcota bacterium]
MCSSVTSGVDDPEGLVGSRRIAPYEIVEVIGRGGMGVVYRAVHLPSQWPVAIKVVSRELTHDLEVVQRFQREASLTGKLRHPNIIRELDFGCTDDGLLYLVMEYVRGCELAEVLRHGTQLPLTRALRVTVQVLHALEEAHGRGIVHRDLKPANIFLHDAPEGPEVVKVMDFGVAKVFQGEVRDLAQLTQSGLMVGTPAYMSPEQILGEPLDGRSDLYSLGIVLYEMLAGAPPFHDDTVAGVMLAQTSDAPRPIGSIRADLATDHKLQAVLDWLLSKRPQDRPANAREAAAMVQLLSASGEEIAARWPSRMEPRVAVLGRRVG